MSITERAHSERPAPSPRPSEEGASAPSIPGDTAPNPTPSPRASRRPIAAMVIGLLALAGLILGARHYLWARTHVRTDNAQVESSVVPVLAKESGFVTRVAAHENQAVRAGDLLVQLDDREYQAKRSKNEADLEVALAAT